MTEDRQEFVTLMDSIGEKEASCEADSLEQAIDAAERLIYPVLIAPPLLWAAWAQALFITKKI